MKPTRDDLLWRDKVMMEDGYPSIVLREVTPADLAAMGLVQAPECEWCGGSGTVTHPAATEREYLEGLMEDRCPKCGGSGYGRLVAESELRHAQETIQSLIEDADAEEAASEAELRAMGWVKLDVDAYLIRDGWEAYTEDNHTTAALSWARLARQVLAALDGEGEA